ncbi:MAG: nucleotidyltransferase family protein [Clostridia bacterium]|nr:nucleotidyltransferase family protein [Clostridia bacterium]
MDFSIVIAEYNPFHIGHLYHLRQAKGDKPLIVVMSGPFVQRGEFAVSDKYLRAQAAIDAGADIVVELPAPFACSPAETFAEGAFKLIKAIDGGKTLSFGSESASIEKIENTAYLLSGEVAEIEQSIKKGVDSGLSYIKARAAALKEYAKANKIDVIDLSNRNDVLAVEYVKAAKGTDIEFAPLKRAEMLKELPYEEASFVSDSRNVLDDGYLPSKIYFPTASDVRIMLDEFEFESVSEATPRFASPVIDFWSDHYKPQDGLLLEALTKDLTDIFDVSEGLDRRLNKAAERAAGFDNAIEKAKTARYTDSRLKRIAVNSLLNVTKDLFRECLAAPAVFNVLAARKDKLPLLDHFNGEKFFNQTALKRSKNPIAQVTARAQDKFNIIFSGANWQSKIS